MTHRESETGASRETAGKRRRIIVRGIVHLLALFAFAYSFALGTVARTEAEGVGAPGSLTAWLTAAAVVFLLAAALHGLLMRSLARGPQWLRNVTAVVLGGVAFGGVGVVSGLWSWPGGPTRLLGLGVVYGTLATFVPLEPDASRES